MIGVSRTNTKSPLRSLQRWACREGVLGFHLAASGLAPYREASEFTAQTPERSGSAHLQAIGWRARFGRRGAMATRAVLCNVPPGTMPLQSQDSPLDAFLKALREEKI